MSGVGIITTIASSKGGSGKSTLTFMLAIPAAARGDKIAVIDADPGGAFSSWHAANYDGEPFACVAEVDHVRIVARARAMAETHRHVIIDTAGFANLTMAAAIACADRVLIPVMADRASVRECLRTWQQVTSLAAASRRAIPARAVRMAWSARGQAEAAAQGDLDAAGVVTLATIIPPIAALRTATFTGRMPRSIRTAAIVDALAAELKHAFQTKPKKGNSR